ncbi:thioesterase domain-containing protein [Streptomyces sp. NPDC004579]|uniref:thioesterase II family protein n=1 Tax=Streptomyces sp. NPDC004579 TaxID=3154667 RepID=UPI0033AA3271
MTDTGGAWFHQSGQTLNPDLRLVCFPHAGGTPNSFRGWASRLPVRTGVLAVCYPGRHQRLTDPLVRTMEVMADRLAEALLPYTDTPLAFFGHSMGAGVAYEVALRLERRAGVRPLRLFASAFRAPHLREPVDLPSDDATLLDELRRLGSATTSALDHPDLLRMVLPTLRADMELVAAYGARRPERVGCPLVAYAGDQDPGCGPDAMRGWSELTGSRFEQRSFPGGHFYLEHREAELLADMSGRLGDDLRLRNAVATLGGRRD